MCIAPHRGIPSGTHLCLTNVATEDLARGLVLASPPLRVVSTFMLLRRGIATRHAAATAVVPRRLSLHLRHLCALPNRVQAETESLHEKVLAPLNSRLRGPLERRPFTSGVPLPIVLLLGNHSSGKSSFINYVLGRDVQTTGVAPTDDGFTVIAPGAEDVDRDGASFIGDPTLGFAPLRTFGPAFMNHFTLKVRTGLATDSMLLVDSPGMIDAPAAAAASVDASGPAASAPAIDRPPSARSAYDFLRVTRWLAEHSDVVLLFFDPDKPGTTGETLECLTTSLSGMEHKLLIVMNKVDQFVHIHDFARVWLALLEPFQGDPPERPAKDLHDVSSAVSAKQCGPCSCFNTRQGASRNRHAERGGLVVIACPCRAERNA